MEKRGEGMAVWGKWRQSEVKNGETGNLESGIRTTECI